MSAPNQFSPAFIAQLLTAVDAMQLLQEADLDNANGLLALLEQSNRLIGVDLETSRSLIGLCRRLAREADLRRVVARADYLEAYIFALYGDFAGARSLLDAARQGFLSSGMTVEALGVNIGLANILIETGEFHNAGAACEEVVRTLTPRVASDEQAARTVAKAQQNLGICYERLGRFKEALAAYTAAEAGFAQLGMRTEQADILVNRGLTFQQIGQNSNALTVFEEAAAVYAAEGLPLFHAEALINIGETLVLLTRYMEGVAVLEEARAMLSAADALSDYAIVLRHLGDAYLALNLRNEALDAYEQAMPFLERTGLRHHQALALWGMGMALAAIRPRDGLANLSRAVGLFEQMGNTRLQAAARLEQAAQFQTQGRLPEAVALAQQALEQAAENEWNVEHVYALMRSADLSESPEQTKALLNRAAELAEPLALPHLHYSLAARQGRVALQLGDLAAAQTLLERAVTEIQRLRGTLLQERMRASFLADKMMAFELLIQVHLERGDYEQAFLVAEQAKSRTLVDLLSGVIARNLREQAEPHEVMELERLRMELDALYNELLAGAPPADDESDHARGSDLVVLSTRAAELERTISLLQFRITGQDKLQTMRSLPAWHPPETTDLPPGQTFIIYHIVGQEVLAFVSSNQKGMQTVRKLCTQTDIEELARRLAAQWDRFRVGSSFVMQHAATLQESAQRVLADLYHCLLKPIEPLLAQMGGNDAIPQLVIVPHGILHQLPFHAFYDGRQYLVERYALSYAPSATVYAYCHQRHPHDGPAVLVGLGDPHIPAAENEVRMIAKILESRNVVAHTLTASAATRPALVEATEGSRFVHLACHGLFRQDNPLFSALRLADGWLTAADLSQLRLDNAIVALSACESGRSQVIGGDEMIGMTYGLLSAGAASLLVSQWLADDQATSLLMATWYEQLADEKDLAGALRSAQLTVKDRYAHPYYWAPFVLIGQRALLPPEHAA